MPESTPPTPVYTHETAKVAQNGRELPKNLAAHPIKRPKLGHSARQEAAIEMLMMGASYTQVAETLAIGRRTLYRWCNEDPDFRQRLNRRRQERFDGTAERMQSLLFSALETLGKQVNDPYSLTAHRAAATLLRLARVGHFVVGQTEQVSSLIGRASKKGA